MTSKTNGNHQSSAVLKPSTGEKLDITQLEQWPWDAACKIRGATDAPKYKDFNFILPLFFTSSCWTCLTMNLTGTRPNLALLQKVGICRRNHLWQLRKPVLSGNGRF